MSGMYERSIEQAQNHLRHEQLFKGTMKGRVMTILATSIVLGLSSQRAGESRLDEYDAPESAVFFGAESESFAGKGGSVRLKNRQPFVSLSRAQDSVAFSLWPDARA